MLNALTSVNITLVVGVVAFIAGVLLSQKVKDKLAGVPSDLRADLKSIEQSVLSRVRAASSAAVAEVHAVTAVNPPAQVAQSAPAPAAPAAPAATNAA